MADEQQQPPEERQPSGLEPGAAGERVRPQEPGEPAAGADETPVHPAGEADETQVSPAIPAGEDETVVIPAVEQPRAGDTSVLPPVPAWEGRSGVPPPSAGGPQVVQDWEEPGGRRWWLPLVIALVALLLLVLLGVGLWLLLRSHHDSGPSEPAVPPPVRPTQVTPTPVQSLSVTTPSVNPSASGQVEVPSLNGLDIGTARSILDNAGLAYRVTSRIRSDVAPGTVLGTDPPAGARVPRSSPITVVVAAGPSGSGSAGASSSPSEDPSMPFLPPVPSPPR